MATDTSTRAGPAAGGSATATMKPTLSLTGITVNAMALIAPGAFLWTTFASQSAQTNGGASTGQDMWLGLLFALVLAFLTAIAYSELANKYPRAGTGSSYYFAEAALLDKEKKEHYRYARIAKFVVGWISHLYYWIYPGIMAAFAGFLYTFFANVAGHSPGLPEVGAVVVVFTALNTYVAFRGVNGSTMAAIIINVIQITALLSFAVFAIVFRLTHPSLSYDNSVGSIISGSHNFMNVLYQGTIAILLLVGFESVTSLGAEAKNPQRDIKRGILLSLAIQGAIMYVFEYFAANLVVGTSVNPGVDASGKALTSGYASAGTDPAPIATMLQHMGQMVFSYRIGQALTLILAGTVLIALFGTMLACLNTGVRITYAMGRDREMPSILGLLHGRFATPHFGVFILGAISAVLGVFAATDPDHLLQIVVASNVGTFLVYGMTNIIAFVAFRSDIRRHVIKHAVVPILGLLANLGMLFGVVYLAIQAGDTPIPGGHTATDAKISIAICLVWIVVGGAWFAMNTRKLKRPAMVGSRTMATA